MRIIIMILREGSVLGGGLGRGLLGKRGVWFVLRDTL